MRVLFLSLLMIASSSVFAAPAAIDHRHDGRQHSHILPVEGLAHRHGGSAGQAVPTVVRRTGTIVYGNRQATAKPPKSDYYDFSSGANRGSDTKAGMSAIDGSSSSSSILLHSHDGRPHNHPLPYQGVAHRHGASSLGIKMSSATSDNNTVIYRSPQHNIRSVIEGLVFGPSDSVRNTQLQITNNTQRSTFDKSRDRRERRRHLTKGDTTCRVGQANCNLCASNVQQQFKRAAANQIRWQTQPWAFNWPQAYPPQRFRPLDIFDGKPVHALGIPDKHVQGFVRTNSPLYPYAGSHSHEKRGGIFVIKQDGSGKKYLSSLHQTKGRHPSGVHIIGKYLAYGLGTRLYFKDINSRNQQGGFSLAIGKTNFGGGLGVVKLANEHHLVITTGPGGQKTRPRYNRFYLLKSLNGRPSSLRLLNESLISKPPQWPRGLAFSENLSVITECGTGDIYTVHTSGDEKGISAITGNGYWKLSKLVQRGRQLELTAINAFTIRQDMKSCNMRAAASVGVTPQNRMEFACHGYAKDPDGSTFNVLGSSSRNRDKFRFRTGIVY